MARNYCSPCWTVLTTGWMDWKARPRESFWGEKGRTSLSGIKGFLLSFCNFIVARYICRRYSQVHWPEEPSVAGLSRILCRANEWGLLSGKRSFSVTPPISWIIVRVLASQRNAFFIPLFLFITPNSNQLAQDMSDLNTREEKGSTRQWKDSGHIWSSQDTMYSQECSRPPWSSVSHCGISHALGKAGGYGTRQRHLRWSFSEWAGWQSPEKPCWGCPSAPKHSPHHGPGCSYDVRLASLEQDSLSSPAPGLRQPLKGVEGGGQRSTDGWTWNKPCQMNEKTEALCWAGGGCQAATGGLLSWLLHCFHLR